MHRCVCACLLNKIDVCTSSRPRRKIKKEERTYKKEMCIAYRSKTKGDAEKGGIANQSLILKYAKARRRERNKS